MTQMAKGLEGKDLISQAEMLKELERSKWYLWHGNVYEACLSIDHLELLLDNDDALTAKRRSLLKALRDFRVYITTNARSFRTMKSGGGTAKRSPRGSWNRPSTKLSVNAS